MNCYNELCVYQENNICTLQSIEVNEIGLCDTCIQISVSEKIIRTIKKEYKEINDSK